MIGEYLKCNDTIASLKLNRLIATHNSNNTIETGQERLEQISMNNKK